MESHDSQEPDNMSTSTTSTSSSHNHKWVMFDGAYTAEYGEAKLADFNDRVRVLKTNDAKIDQPEQAVIDAEPDAKQLSFACMALGCGKPFSGFVSEPHPNIRCPHCSVVHLVSTEGKAVYVFLAGKRTVRCLHCSRAVSIQFNSDQFAYKCEKCDTVHLLRLRGKAVPEVVSSKAKDDLRVDTSQSFLCCFCFSRSKTRKAKTLPAAIT